MTSSGESRRRCHYKVSLLKHNKLLRYASSWGTVQDYWFNYVLLMSGVGWSSLTNRINNTDNNCQHITRKEWIRDDKLSQPSDPILVPWTATRSILSLALIQPINTGRNNKISLLTIIDWHTENLSFAADDFFLYLYFPIGVSLFEIQWIDGIRTSIYIQAENNFSSLLLAPPHPHPGPSILREYGCLTLDSFPIFSLPLNSTHPYNEVVHFFVHHPSRGLILVYLSPPTAL